jgi:hypothetical protein
VEKIVFIVAGVVRAGLAILRLLLFRFLRRETPWSMGHSEFGTERRSGDHLSRRTTFINNGHIVLNNIAFCVSVD